MKYKLNAVIVSAVAAGFLLAGCNDCDLDRYARWRPVKILGKEKTFYCLHDGGPGTAMNRSLMPVVGGWGETRGLNDIWWFTGYFPEKMKFENGYYWKKDSKTGKSWKEKNKMPYSVWETMGPDVHYNHSRRKLRELHETRPDVPFLLKGFLDSCFPWFMKDKYDCDVSSWVEFRKTYTNFVAITTLNESDGSFGNFNSAKQVTNLQMRAYMDAAFPPAKTYKDRVKWMEKAMQRQRAMYFGADEYQSTYSVNSKWGHVLAKYGVKILEYECESQILSGPWRYSMAHVRGVARQYQIPWIWYAAHLITSYTRDGKAVGGEWHFPNKWRPKDEWPKNYHENVGTARSIVKRSHAYGYFAGANAIALENDHYCIWDDLREKPRLSKYGQDIEDVMLMAEETPRGICYTPVAVLTGIYEKFCRTGCNGFGNDAFFFTWVPVLSEDGYKHRDEKNGDQGIMFNSEFGELCDVLTPDAGQKPGDFAAALAPYKWAFMMGSYDEAGFERSAVREWVEKGGTLVTSYDLVTNDLVSAEMAGVDFTDEVVKCGEELVDFVTKRVAEGSMRQTFSRGKYKASLDYELHVAKPRTATPLYVDEDGNVIAWINSFGKGRVVTYTAVQGVPRILSDRRKYYKELPIDDFFGIKPEYVAGRVTFPLQREMLRRCQDETMPVKVEGDIQWGVNFVAETDRNAKGERCEPHMLVWLLNNKGVKKFAFEEEDIDHAFDAKVRITNKKTGKSVEVTVPAGGYTWKIL